LKAIVPINSCSNIFDATYPLGVLNLELLARWVYLMLQCRDPNAAGLSRAIRLARTVSQMNLVYKHLPLITFDEILLGKRVQFIRDILEHLQANDPFWVQRGMKLDLCDHGNCPPANLLTGWYDVFIRGALKDFEKLQNAGIDSRLTIGNWCHWDILLQTKHGIDDALEWFDVYLNGKKSDGLFNYPIKLFLMGRNSWLSLKHFPPKDATLTEFLLSENGLLLQESKMTRYMNTESLNSNRFVHYKFDPKDPTPSIGGASFDCNNTGPKNNAILEKRADIAIFSSEIIAEEVTVIGYIRARILVWSSSEHAHFIARLCDVSPSNESIILCDGIAKISEGTKILTLSSIECDGKTFDNIGIYEVTIDMAATANVFRVGHRVRVHIASGAHPRWARNLGNGTDHTGTIENSRESMQAIFYQVGDRLSSVSLPLTRIAQ
jgi:putative CocE/NonD family hydrolase